MSKKVDILQIEDQYNQSVAIYLKTLKNKLKSLEKWEFEKRLYQSKIETLKNKNKMLKTKLKLAHKENQTFSSCCPLLTSCTRAVQVFPEEDDLRKSDDSCETNFSDSLVDSQNNEEEENSENQKTIKCLSLLKTGAIATGLLV